MKEKIKLILLHFLDIFLLLLTSKILQELIDNQQPLFLFIGMQIARIILNFYKSYLYYQKQKQFDEKEIQTTLYLIYHLKSSFLKTHEKEEISQRLEDTYVLKKQVFYLWFDFSSDCILLFCIFLILCISHLLFTCIFFSFCLPFFIFILLFSKKYQNILENRRTKEAQFFYYYKKSFQSCHFKEEYQQQIYFLEQFQKEDQKLLKFNLFKNNIFSSLEVIIQILLLSFYCFERFSSFGTFFILLQLSSMLLQPMLNILQAKINFSNHRLLKKRIQDLKNHQDCA